jgi:hypothetical protein
MNYETNRNIDLTLTVPIYPPSSYTPSSEPSAPSMLFGAGMPAELVQARENVRKLTDKIAEVLKVLNEAHLAGNLHAGDLHAKQVLEAWYMQLQAETRAAQPKRK